MNKGKKSRKCSDFEQDYHCNDNIKKSANEHLTQTFASIVLTLMVNNDSIVITKTAIVVTSIVYARRKLEDNLK